MLVLSRKVGQSIQIGDDVTVKVTKIDGSVIKVAIEAPKGVKIVRSELPKRKDGDK